MDFKQKVTEAFDFDTLKSVCEMHENDFEKAYEMERVECTPRMGESLKGDNGWPNAEDRFYLFEDNGAKILAVAHLDTVVRHDDRGATIEHGGKRGPVVRSGALDDRLGAYTILELMPRLGIEFDVLLTTGEEDGDSTAQWFDPEEHGVEDRYNWIIEFDRGGTDVVLYQYHDATLEARVESSGAFVEQGIFSDISFMEHVGRKAINWGVGYRDYHSVKGHVYLDDYFLMMTSFLLFHEDYKDTTMPHTEQAPGLLSMGREFYFTLDDSEDEEDYCCIEWLSSTGDRTGCGGDMYDTEDGPLCENHVYFLGYEITTQ